jgi:phenylacetate-coenzyme A ligase PaaK-like adenylate-forming protein
MTRWDQTVEAQLIDELPRQLFPRDVPPELLAPMFRLPLTAPRTCGRFGRALEQRLLDLTVHQAVEGSSFYRRLYDNLAPDRVIDREQLAGLPIVRREDIESAGAEICCRSTHYASSSYTSGSTSQRPLVIDRSREELAYLTEFLPLLGDAVPQQQEPPVILLIVSWYHGTQLNLGGDAITLPVDLSKRVGLSLSVMLLSREFEVNERMRRINMVAGPTGRLIHLTSYLMANGHAELVAPVKLVQMSGAPITPFRRRWLEDFWRCAIVDRYSLTEMFLSANRCAACGWFHFDPSGLAEVVDLTDEKPLRRGRGVLLLTGFYPFNQRTPLIRYAPGDLAEVAEVDCPGGLLGYRFLGRTGSVLVLDRELGAGSFLSSLELYEALDGIADVRRRGDAMVAAEDREAARTPAFEAGRRADGQAVVAVELRWVPAMFPERAAVLRGEIAAAIAKTAPAVAPLLERGALAVELFAPGCTPAEYRGHLRARFPSQADEPESTPSALEAESQDK